MSSRTLTPLDVQHLFEYVDGVLIWRENHGRARAGAVAGTKTEHGQDIGICGKLYRRRRLVWALKYGKWPEHSVCALNHDPLDDRIENLVDLPDVARRHNTREQQRTLPVGVWQAGKRYQACCNHKYVGTFDTPEAAHAAYIAAHIEAFGMLSTYAPGVPKCL